MTRIGSNYTKFSGRSLRPGTVAPRVVAGVALISISLVSATAVLRSRVAPVGVLVFSHDMDAGAVLSDADVSEAAVAATGDTLDHLVRSEERGSVMGLRLLKPSRAGEPILRSSFAPDSSETPRRLVQLHAARAGSTPDLAPGDSVDVLASFTVGTEAARTVVVASAVKLISVSAPATDGDGIEMSGSGKSLPSALGGQPGILCTVEVAAADLVRLVFASQNAVVSVVRSIPGESVLGREMSGGVSFDSDTSLGQEE
ncbi:MAG: hypothetical protein C4318_04195 [Acidimicrobiia bacterium]